jgi:hypothetical protein
VGCLSPGVPLATFAQNRLRRACRGCRHNCRRVASFLAHRPRRPAAPGQYLTLPVRVSPCAGRSGAGAGHARCSQAGVAMPPDVPMHRDSESRSPPHDLETGAGRERAAPPAGGARRPDGVPHRAREVSRVPDRGPCPRHSLTAASRSLIDTVLGRPLASHEDRRQRVGVAVSSRRPFVHDDRARRGGVEAGPGGRFRLLAGRPVPVIRSASTSSKTAYRSFSFGCLLARPHCDERGDRRLVRSVACHLVRRGAALAR